MLLDVLAERGVPVFGIGKIHDIYNGRGVEKYVTTTGNADGMSKMAAALQERKSGLIFCNLVDFDMLYGHRKDVEGFAESLEEFDRMLAPFLTPTGRLGFDDNYRRPRLRPGSALADDRSLARVRPDPRLFAGGWRRQ